MLVLWGTVASAGTWNAPSCSSIETKAIERGAKVRFDEEDPPRNIVPQGYHRLGLVKPRGTWIDERGRRYAFREVEVLLLQHAVAREPYSAWRQRRLNHSMASSEVGWADKLNVRPLEEWKDLLEAVEKWEDYRNLSGLHRAVCLFNTTQPKLLDDEVDREARMAAIVALRGGKGPPLSAWALVDQLYRAADLTRPAAEGFGADVEAVWALVQGGASPDELHSRAAAGVGTDLVQRLGLAPQ